MTSTQDLERIANGGHWDSVQAPQIARELIAARGCAFSCWVAMQLWDMGQSIGPMAASVTAMRDALQAYDAAREAE